MGFLFKKDDRHGDLHLRPYGSVFRFGDTVGQPFKRLHVLFQSLPPGAGELRTFKERVQRDAYGCRTRRRRDRDASASLFL